MPCGNSAALQKRCFLMQLYDIIPCSDYHGKVQMGGKIENEEIALQDFVTILTNLGFRIFSLGNPVVFICRRQDCLFLLHADGNFSISEVSSKEILSQILNEIKNQIRK